MKIPTETLMIAFENEIEWHKETKDKPHLSKVSDEYKKGFIEGLEQGKKLIQKLSKTD